MADRTDQEIDEMIDQSLSSDKSELDFREKELDDGDLKKVFRSEKIQNVTAIFLEFNEFKYISMPRLKIHSKRTISLPSTLINIASCIIKYTEHRD